MKLCCFQVTKDLVFGKSLTNMKKLLIFGDSIVYGKWDSQGGWVTRLRMLIDEKHNITKRDNYLVYSLGVPSELTVKLSDRFESELRCRLDAEDEEILVIVATGINDSCPNNRTTNQQTPENIFKAALKSIITTATTTGCKLILLGLTPVNPEKSKGLKFTNVEVKKYDGYLSDVAKELNVNKIDMFDSLMTTNYRDLLVDSAHPNDEGHKLIVDIVWSELQKIN
jgi:lysophospholipase L1-like esterase